ncbi:hypothetical protein ABES36_14350 [Bacillus pseudomycoides]|uniref:hypothetical protein n=1 Tax=Bacillus pseudomycoides TaxID=64104 RepID=UPI003D1ED9D6
MSNDKSELIETNKGSRSVMSLQNFENYLQELGLPHEGIIASDRERKLMQGNLPEAIHELSPQSKRNAVYLSKFVASSAIGLYDAALNYLWNEVVLSLREKVSVYGLDLFFDAAVGGELRDTYSTDEDLSSIKDNTLIDTCRKLELISDLLHEKLKHILYMRNNIGASHPTMESIKTFELLGWLETCVKDIIEDRPSEAALFVQHLIVNLKNEELVIDAPRIEQIKENLMKQNTRISGNLLTTLFSIFTKKNTSPNVRDNILKLAPVVWDISPDNIKYDIGFKLDHFGLHLDEETLSLGNRFLEKCNGVNYKSEGTRSRELNSLLDRLIEVHHSRDNFHHEVPITRQIKNYIVEESDILPSFEDKLIKTILICRIGNGTWYCDGVSPGAKPIYDEIIKLFNSKQINTLIKYMSEPEIRTQFSSEKCVFQAKKLLEIVNLDLQEARTREAIEFILENIESYKTKIFTTKELKDCLKFLYN